MEGTPVAVNGGCLSRRSVLGLAGTAIALAATPLRAQWSSETEVIKLWPGTPPNTPTGHKIAFTEDFGPTGNRSIRGIAEPVLIVRRAARPSGSGIVLIPGGAYARETIDSAGFQPAEMLNRLGITAFILAYRLPGEGWDRRADVPLQDAQRAMRLIRSNAAKYRVSPDRLGVIGFSAGGHLAGSIATRFDEKLYALSDAAENVSARPDLVGMLYPVVTMCSPLTHKGSQDRLIGAAASDEQCRRYSVDQAVSAKTPPVFLAQAADDAVVPIENSIIMYRAMLAQKQPVAMHLFEKGGHGFTTNLPKTSPASAWPELFIAFAASHGFAVT